MKKQIRSIFFLVAFLFTSASFADRIGFSSEEWQTIRTEHFDIVFTAKQQDLGLYYANIAEQAYANLATVFINKPERVIIIVNDTTDVSNGYATRIPYAHIMAYSVPIGEQETLSEAGEWGRELITHELTHIMQLDPALGVYRFIRPVFGTIVAPNLLMPLWWKEGMAVEMETQFSPQGRTRSKFQDATLRAMVLDQKLFEYTLPQANEVLPSWPYGSRPYLFGSLFFSSLVHDSDIHSVNKLVSRQGERAPYAVEEPMLEIVNRTYEDQYSKALYEANDNANAQIAKLKEQTLSTPQLLKVKGQNASWPRWSEELKMVAVIEQVENKSVLSVYNEKLQRITYKKLPDGALSGLEFQPRSKKILYTKVDLVNSKYQIADLYLYDLNAQKSDRVTTNQRAREASFSDDGQNIVFVATENGRTQIKVLNLVTKNIETLLSGGFDTRFQSPIFWKTNEVLFSKMAEDGSQKLFSLGLTDKKETPVDLGLEGIRFLRKKKDLLYFTSSENGVNNVYVTSDLKTAVPVTHVPGGIWSFDVDSTHSKIWSTNMTGEGFQVAQVEMKKRTVLPKVENKLAERYNYKPGSMPKTNYPAEAYAPSQYLIPTYWIPYVASSTNSRGVYFQAQTSGHDPINVHEYSLLGSYDSALQKGGFYGFYTNSTMSVPVQIAATARNQAFGDINNVVETKVASLALLPDLFRINKDLRFEIGVQILQTELFGVQTQHWGPYFLTQYYDYSKNIFQISPEKGWGAFLKYEKFQNMKDSRDYNKVMASLVGYFGPWLPKHHTFMTRVSSLLTFESVPARFGTSNDTSFLNSDLVIPQFVLRGYSPSQFYGRSVWNTNIEYRFPLTTINKGHGTDAYFLKRVSGAVVVDGLGVEGGSLTETAQFERRNLNESFWSTGIELKLETTIGYVLPMNFILGGYMPHSPLYRSSPQIGVSFQIGGF